MIAWPFTSDIEAFQNGGIADDHIFFVGDEASLIPEVNALTDEEAYTSHLPFVDGVSAACGS